MNTSIINDNIREILSAHKKVRLNIAGKQPSGVLIPVYVEDGTHHLVFTRRSQLVRHHKGEISFPGGGYDLSDCNLMQTALRESFEEIGLDPQKVDILGELDDTLTRNSNYVVSPFVGLVPAGYRYTISDYEIGELIQIPVDALLISGCYKSDFPSFLEGNLLSQIVYTYQEKQVTGATARILKQFLDVYTQAVRAPACDK